MLDRQDRIDSSLAPEGYTPTLDRLDRRIADFETLGEALDYASRGNRGMNFHDARGTLQQPSDTVRYTLPEIITCRWQACASAIDGQGTSRPLPA